MEPPASATSVQSAQPNVSDDSEDHDHYDLPSVSSSMSTMDVHSQPPPPQSQPSSAVTSSRASSSPLSIAEQIRKNLDKKRQKRPKDLKLVPNRSEAVTVATTKEGGALPDIAPRRKSLLDYAEGDLAKSGQKSVLFRFVAVGSHEEDPEQFMKLHQKIIEVINTACYDEPASGYFIVYPKHFTHILEGSELTINKYIAICAELFQGKTQNYIETDFHSRPDKTYTARMVILNFIVSRDRYATDWYHVVHLNPAYRGIMQYRGFRKRLFECVKTCWVLLGVLAETKLQTKPTTVVNDDPEAAALERENQQELHRAINDKLHTLFPGIDTLNYFLKPKRRVPPLRTPAEHIEKFWTVPNIILDSEVVWPVPCRLAPYH